jgi:PadR family transcriptional regulator, regulatory protein PadR
MGEVIRMTDQRFEVLICLFKAERELSGADVIRETGLASGSVYPILYAFQRKGLVESRREEETPQALKHPQRSFYRLTALGEEVAHDENARRKASVLAFESARA